MNYHAIILFSFFIWIVPQAMRAGTTWVMTPAVDIDEVVAETGYTPMRHLGMTLLRSFRYPHIGADENITFIADDPLFVRNPVNRNHGIYRSYAEDGTLGPLIMSGFRIAGSSGQVTQLRGLQQCGDDLTFTTADDEGKWAVHHWKNGLMTVVAHPSFHTIPGFGPLSMARFSDVRDGRIVYTAFSGNNTKSGIVVYDIASQKNKLIVKTGDRFPSDDNERFGHFNQQPWLCENGLVFLASRSNEQADVYRTTHVLAFFDVDWRDESTLGHHRITRVVGSGDARPGSNGKDFYTFVNAIIDGGRIAFIATDKRENKALPDGRIQRFMGLYSWTKDQGAKVVVDTDTEIEGLFNGPFSSIIPWITLEGDILVFIASAEDEAYQGVFAYNFATDELYKMIDNRITIDGRKVRNFETSRNFHSNGRFALMINFQDGHQGVYLAQMPRVPFVRKSAP